MIARPATPASTPPTIAPTGGEDFPEAPSDSVAQAEVDVGLADDIVSGTSYLTAPRTKKLVNLRITLA